MRRLKLNHPRQNSRRIAGSVPLALLAILGLMTLSIAWAGDEPALNRLTQVEIQETDQATKIVIRGTVPPTFTVFKLSDPPRLFVDVSNADVSGLRAIDVGNGVVASVAPLQYNDDVVHVGRIIVQLELDALYKVSAKGNALHIQIDASARKTRRPVAVSGVEINGEIAARAASAERRAQAALADAASARAQATTAREQASEAQDRASVAEGRASAAETQLGDARSQLGDAETRATTAELAAVQANSRATTADGRADRADRAAEAASAKAKAAATAAASAEKRAGSLERQAVIAAERVAKAHEDAKAADNRANTAQGDKARAEARAAEADSKVAAANARAARLEANTARLASRVEALDRRRAGANAEISRLESSKAQLAMALASAEADRDDARSKALQAEQQAQSTALVAERAQLAQLEMARAKSKIDQRLNGVQSELAAAKAADKSAEVTRLEQRLAALENDASGLRGTLKSREAELAAARKTADASRVEADRLKRERDTLATAKVAAAKAAAAKAAAAKVAAAKVAAAKVAAAEVAAAEVAAAEVTAAEVAAAKVAAAKVAAAKARPIVAAPAPVKPKAVPAKPKAAKPAPVVAAKVARTRVTKVEFADDDSGSRITVHFKGPGDFELKSEGKQTRILELVNAEIDPAIERSLDTGAFKSAVQLVSSFQAPPPNQRVRIVVTLDTDVKSNVKSRKGTLTWHFAEPRIAAPVVAVAPPAWKPAEVKYEAPQAAAYIANAAPVASASRNTLLRRKKHRYRGRKINIDIKDGDIHNVLRLLAKEGNINIVTSDDVGGTVTIHLKMVPWDEALKLVLDSKGLGAQISGSIWRIAPKTVLAKELSAEAAAMKHLEQLRPTSIRLMTVNHARASKLLARVKDVMSPRGTVSVDERTNTLILKDMIEFLDAAEDMIRRLDSQTPQVLIEARIVEVNSQSQRELGIQWGGDAIFSAGTGNPTGLLFPSTVGIAGGSDDTTVPSGGTGVDTPNFVVNLPAATGGGSGGALGMTFGALDNTINLNVRLSALQSQGTVKIVSSPKITTLDNQEALISQGVSIPISQVSATGVQTTFFDAVLELKVRPQVTQDGNVYLELNATNNTPDFQNVGARGDPTILKKEAKTQLLLKDGDTTVIGGIYTSNSGFSRSEVPFFASIPIIGALFRKSLESERRTELLIFITPRIVNRRAATVRTAQ